MKFASFHLQIIKNAGGYYSVNNRLGNTLASIFFQIRSPHHGKNVWLSVGGIIFGVC